MAIELIVNSLWQSAAHVFITNVFGAEQTSEMDGILNVTAGPRHLLWRQSGTATRRVVYQKDSGGLAVDRLIVTNADAHVGQQLNFIQWPDPHPTVGANIVSFNPFNPTLIGPRSQDFLYTTSQSAKYAIGLETVGTYTRKFGKFYGGTAFTFAQGAGAIFRPAWEVRMLEQHAYAIEHLATFVFFKLTRAQVHTLQNLYRLLKEPVFFYDSTGTVIADKLWHGIILGIDYSPRGDDMIDVKIETGRLRHY